MTRYCSVLTTALILIGTLTFSISAKSLNINNAPFAKSVRNATDLLGPIEFKGRIVQAIKNKQGKTVGYHLENGSKMIFGQPGIFARDEVSAADRLVCSSAGISIYTRHAPNSRVFDLESCLEAIKVAGAAAYDAYQVCQKDGVSSWKCKFAAGKATALLGFAVYECSGLISERETLQRIDDEKNRPREEEPCLNDDPSRDIDYFDGKSLDSDGYSINCGPLDF